MTNAYELAELKRELEPQGVTVEATTAPSIPYDTRIATVFTPRNPVYELRAGQGWGMMAQRDDAWWHYAAKYDPPAHIAARNIPSRDDCIRSILAMIR